MPIVNIPVELRAASVVISVGNALRRERLVPEMTPDQAAAAGYVRHQGPYSHPRFEKDALQAFTALSQISPLFPCAVVGRPDRKIEIWVRRH